MAQQRVLKLSIWEKSKERSIAKKYLHGNFEAGHKKPNEYYLGRAGLRGRKRWLCLAIFVLVYLFALAHLTLTCVILGVLRFNFNGSPYLIFQGDGSLAWPRGASLSDIRLSTPSTIRSYMDQTLILSGKQKDQLTLRAAQLSTTGQLSLDGNSVNFSIDSLTVHSGSGHQSSEQAQLVVRESAVEMKNLLTANHLLTTRMSTNTVRNVSGLRADNQLHVRGAMGVTVEGSQIDIDASGDIRINSSTVITIGGGRVELPALPREGSLNSQYHLCLCGSSGKLFFVETNPLRCSRASNIMCT